MGCSPNTGESITHYDKAPTPPGIVGEHRSKLNGNLAPDLDQRIRGHPEIIAQMHGIALHHRKTRRDPLRQSFAILAGENGFVTYIIGDVRKVDAAATLMGLTEQRWNIRMLHESITGRRSPELRGDFRHRETPGVLDPRNRLGVNREHEKTLVERPVVVDVPHHHRGDVLFRARQIDRRSRHAGNLSSRYIGHECVDGNDPLLKPRGNGFGAAMPDEHDAIGNGRQKKRHLSAGGNLGEIGGRKRSVHYNEHACNSASPQKTR